MNCRLLHPSRSDTVKQVKVAHLMLTLLLVALWLPASSHVLLEHLGLIHEAHSDHDSDSTGSHEHDDDNHSVADGNCLLTPTGVKVPAPQQAFPLSLIGYLAKEWAFDLDRHQIPSGLAPPGTTPPELSHRWQFSSRAALPVRAPSFVS